MREILFRGKRIDNKEWVYGSLSMGGGVKYDKTRAFIEEHVEVLKRIEVDPETVGQYIEHKDANYRMIFSRDIVRSNIQGEKEYTIDVIRDIRKIYPLESGHSFDNSWIDFIIIGNMDDNPELLKEGDSR